MTKQLNESRFRLVEDIESRALPDGTRLLKQTRVAEYLSLNPTEQRILDRFDGSTRVQDILVQLLCEDDRPTIRAFYALVLRALDGGFLADDADGVTPPATRAPAGRRWSLAWGPIPVLVAAGLFIPLGLGSLAWGEFLLPSGLLQWLLLVVLVSVLLTVANTATGCVLSGFGRQVYQPRLHWNLGIPFLAVDTRDGFMGGKFCQACVALQAVCVPLAAITLAPLLESRALLLAGCVATLFLTSPFGDTPAHSLLHVLFRRAFHAPLNATDFLTRKLFRQVFKLGKSLKEGRYLFAYSGYAIVWLGLLILFSAKLIKDPWNVVVGRILFAPSASAQLLSVLLSVLLVGLLLAPVVCEIWVVLRNAYALLAPRWFNAESAVLKQVTDGAKPPSESIIAFLRNTLLFADLPVANLEHVAKAMTFARIKGGTDIVREGDPGDTLFIIHSGEVAILKEDEAGTPKEVAALEEGDVFGEIALLDRVPRTATVRAAGPVSVLMLPRQIFQDRLVHQLGAEQVRTVIQVCNFIRRIDMFSEWPDRGLLAFAREFTPVDFAKGQTIIREGEANEKFYLIYEGQCDVRQGGTQCACLGAGEFFGEISLLKGTDAIADVVAAGPCRCLALSRDKFLRFITEDVLTGLAVESVMDQRLPPELN